MTTQSTFPQYAIDEIESLVETIKEFAPADCTRIMIIESFVKNRLAEKLQYYGDNSLKYAISQLSAEKQAEYIPQIPENKDAKKQAEKMVIKVKSQPAGYTRICTKCAGNGIYAMEIRNGQPWSLTGTTCYKCNGRGWTK